MTRRAWFAAAAVAAATAAAAAATVARAAGVDLPAVAARVDAQIADAATPRNLRPRYLALRRKLAAKDRTGLADDLAKVSAVAAAVHGPLAGDTVLADAAGAAVDDALDAIRAAAATTAVAALDLTDARSARSVASLLHRCRDLESAARVERIQSRDDRAAAKGRTAAATLDRAAKLVPKSLARQDRRAPRWSVVLDGRPAALLSVLTDTSGPSPVYVAGAGDAEGPTFLRGGAEGFVRIPIDGAGDLWWVDRVPGAGVWAVGSAGRVVTYDPATGALGAHDVPAETGVLYGVWGAAADDVWTVGADPDGFGAVPAAFHWDGAGWSGAALPAEAAGRTLFKVWGASANDVLVCGDEGLLLRFDGAAWTVVPSGASEALLTVHGPVPAVAVGFGPAIVERGADGTWSQVPLPPGTQTLSGVRVGAGGDAWAVGNVHTALRRGARGWKAVAGVPQSVARDFHSVAIDAQGGVWIAGGALPSLSGGVLLHFGTRPVAGADVLPRADLGTRLVEVFNREGSCAQTACHAPPFLSESLDLATVQGLRARLGGVPCNQTALPLVAPGRPSGSYLFRKVAGTHLAAGGRGDTMPQGAAPLPPADVDAIRAWILEGALDD